MDLGNLMKMMKTHKSLDKAWELIRLEIFTKTLRRLTTPETIEAELQKSLADFLEKQATNDELSKFVSEKVGEGVVREIYQNVVTEEKLKEAAFEMPI